MRYEGNKLYEFEEIKRKVTTKEEVEIIENEPEYDASGLSICITRKDTGKVIACIQCHFIESDRSSESNTMYIKRLFTENFRNCGIATYLVNRVIKIAEEQKIQRITVHPKADDIDRQKDLEKFYKRFYFTSTSQALFFHRKEEEKQIEFLYS